MAHGQAAQTVMPARVSRGSYRHVRPPSDERIVILECTGVSHLGADDHARNRLARGGIDDVALDIPPGRGNVLEPDRVDQNIGVQCHLPRLGTRGPDRVRRPDARHHLQDPRLDLGALDHDRDDPLAACTSELESSVGAGLDRWNQHREAGRQPPREHLRMTGKPYSDSFESPTATAKGPRSALRRPGPRARSRPAADGPRDRSNGP